MGPERLLALAARLASKKNRPWIDLVVQILAAIRKAIETGQKIRELKNRPLGDFVSDDALAAVMPAHQRADDFERGGSN